MSILRKLAAAAAVLSRQNDPDCLDVAAALDRVAMGLAESVDAELGLRRKPGQRSAATLARHGRRNGLLVAWRAALLPEVDADPAARIMHQVLARYRAAAWSRERDLAELPPRRLGTHEEFAWRVLREVPRVVGADRIRHLLGVS